MNDKDKLITQLTLEEVLEILNLIEKSDFDYFQLEAGDLKLTVGKKGFRARDEGSMQAASANSAAAGPEAAADEKTPPVQSATPGPVEPPTAREGTVPVTAPMVGTLYLAPEPGADPFVKLGDRVEAGTTVGLIEVMKVFNAVSAGVEGLVTEICVQSGQFVEYGQTLFFVKPDGTVPG